MKIVFFGSSNFAIPSLEKLVSKECEVLCVVTQPDKNAGRHMVLTPPPVKIAAQNFGLSLFQPEALNSDGVYSRLKGFNADLFVVVSYGKIIPKKIIQLPGVFSINVHASLLPKYRGASPVNYALMNGERMTGVSIIKMNEFIDKGDILLQSDIPIKKGDDAESLSVSLAELGARSLIRAIGLIKDGKYTLTKQDDAKASYAPKLTKKDGLIDWSKSSRLIVDKVRGLVPWPGSYTFFNSKVLKVYSVEEVDYKVDKPQKYGEIIDITHDAIIVRVRDAALALNEVQPASGKRMRAAEFIIGHKLKKGDLLG